MKDALGYLAALALACAVIALTPAVAGAQSCGDDDDGGSSSSSDDYTYGDDGDDGDTAPARPRCVEASQVVGYTRCRRFGRWSGLAAPALRFTLGTSLQRLRLGHMSFSGDTEHFNIVYGIGDAGRNLDDTELFAGGPLVRIDLGFLDYLSVGVEGSFASTTVSGTPRVEGGVLHTPTSVTSFAGGLVLGLAWPIDVLTLRAEVLLGGRAVILDSETRVDDCVESSWSIVHEGVVEPRLAADVFVTPWVSVNGWVGMNVVVPGEVHGGLGLTVHTRTYDGQPGR